MEEEEGPEKEPLVFDVPSDLPQDVQDVTLHIKQLAEKTLYHWKSFPLTLPSSITDTHSEHDGVITFKDLFLAPTFDELEQVARDNKGDAKWLNKRQLRSIRKSGEFEVDSIHFPGQVHRWRLSQLLQKGTQRAHESLLNDLALATRLMVITARNRFYSHFFSLSQSVRGLYTCLWQLLDILIGMPYTTPGDLLLKVQEEHTRFLVAELVVQGQWRRQWLTFCDYLRDKCSLHEAEKHKDTELTPPSPPYVFQTPKGSPIDLRLLNRDLMNRCLELLRQILDRESKGWHVKYKDHLIMELKGQNLSHTEITEYVNNAIFEEYKRRVFDAVARSQEIENLNPGLGPLLVEQAKSHLIMEKSICGVRDKLYKHEQQQRALLVKTFPVRSRIQAWVNECLQEFKEDFIRQNQWCAHIEALEHCRQNRLDQSAYFLHRDLIFMRDREPVLKSELSRVRDPCHVFRFGTRIWLPENWVVRRQQYGQSEVVPTVIVDTPLSSAARREPQEDQPTFTVDKYTVRKTSTRFPMWRWFNSCHRTWAWTWNAMFVLGVLIPWCSPVGLRALFSPWPFMPDLELSPVDGTLCPKKSSRTLTLWSRLRSLWKHVYQARATFESIPDTGFLGKSFTRHLNRVWNYGVKGACGSLVLVLVSVPLCLAASTLSLLTAATAPLWMPVVALVAHLFAVLIYDYDHPVEGNAIMYLLEALLYRGLLLGCLQPIAALFTAIILLPLAAFLVLVVGVIRRGSRTVWDAFMFHAVIKKRGRVPWSDGFVARRVAGPGLASHYFYQVGPGQVLAAVEARMERHELKAWQQNTAQLIQQPLTHYREFIETVFGPFSAGLRDKGVYKALDLETKQYLGALNAEVNARKQKLDTGLTPDVQSRIKLSARELKVTITQTGKLLQEFYPDRVLRRLTKPEADFWEEKHLETSDWQGLATQLLTEVFSPSFLTPLEETDTCFKLQLEHLNLARYLEMLKSAEFRDDLDVVSTVHTPKGDIDVDAPYLEAATFCPSKDRVRYADSVCWPHGRHGQRRRPWKKRTLRLSEIEKLEVPLPIAHPATVAVLIHNRENDSDMVDLSDEMCARIVRAAHNLPYINHTEPGDLYETDLSTPERTTTTSEPEISHLAEQESAFSEDGAPLSISNVDAALMESSTSSAPLSPTPDPISPVPVFVSPVPDPVSPASIPASPASILASPASIPVSPASIPASPASIPTSPASIPESRTYTPDSSISIPESTTPVQVASGHSSAGHSPRTSLHGSHSSGAEGPSTSGRPSSLGVTDSPEGARVVYEEAEEDTSCVVAIRESSSERDEAYMEGISLDSSDDDYPATASYRSGTV